MNVKFIEIYSILKIMFNIIVGILFIITLIPIMFFGCIYFFIKYLIYYEAHSNTKG